KTGIKCDYTFPCQQCVHASLECKRDHVPQKRGPKRGNGRVINRLRELDNTANRTAIEVLSEFPSPPPFAQLSFSYNSPIPMLINRPSSADMETDSGLHPAATSYHQPPTGTMPLGGLGPGYMTQFGSVGAAEWPSGPAADISYHYLIPQCVELYEEHIYPIMPLLNIPALRAMLRRPLAPPDENLIYALSALTCLHMLGESITVPGPDSWERAGCFFIERCIAARKSYDLVQDLSLSTVIASFWLSASFFEIEDTRKSWYYLREALTLALELGLQNDASYAGLGPEEDIFHRRVFWQLFVSERSFAILRYRPIVLKKTPKLPAKGHAYESPDIHSGFMRLIASYMPLDESFVSAWNDGSDPHVSGAMYLALQNHFDTPLSFASESSQEDPHAPSHNAQGQRNQNRTMAADIQKADLLITQQWLRFITWMSSSRLGLLSWHADHASMHFTFPLTIAQQTASILAHLPPAAVEVHGMGILEKIFEISAGCINVLDAYDRATAAGTHITGPGLDSDPDLLGIGAGAKGKGPDQIACFVKTLSALPKSRTQFADRLVELASQRSGGNTALSYPLSYQTSPTEYRDISDSTQMQHEESTAFNTADNPFSYPSIPYDTNPSGFEAWPGTMPGIHNSDPNEHGGPSNSFAPGPGLRSSSGMVSPEDVPVQQSHLFHHGGTVGGDTDYQRQQQQHIPIDPDLM
ncbi:hypothetical protein B0T19DRAFT_360455, partial [Cercophora scortea]